MEQQQENQQPKPSVFKNKWVQSGGVIVLLLILAASFVYFKTSSSRVSIDTSLVSAPVINLSPTVSDQLNAVYVTQGQNISANTAVALVGQELIESKVAGQVVFASQDIGSIFTPGETVVSMVDPIQLRVVGTIDENKGLERIKVGQLASFTVDAFGSKQYQGVVDEITPTANSSDVVFNISDARPTQQFNVNVRFNVQQYPELKNGMSAKLTIYTK